jgi:hypothetical protein
MDDVAATLPALKDRALDATRRHDGAWKGVLYQQTPLRNR